MHAMEKPHKMMMAIRLETQLSRICTRRHRRAVWVGGVESSHHVCMRVVRACAMHSGDTRALWGVDGLTAPIVPLPHETQRFNLVPKGERASMALTCASEHSCGSLLEPPMLVDKRKTVDQASAGDRRRRSWSRGFI